MTKKTSPSARSCYLVSGGDEASVKATARALSEKLAPGADAFGLEVVDGAVETVDASVLRIEETVGALLTLPFLGGKKLVWLKSVSFLTDTVTGRSEAVLEALARLCDTLESGLPEGVSFLLSAPGADKRRSAYLRLSKLCETTTCELPDIGFRGGEEALIEWVGTEVRKRGLQLDADAVEALASRVGLDTMQMEGELAKLETAFGKAAVIVAEDIRMLVPQTRQGGIFDLSGAVLRRDLPLALESLAQLFHQGEKSVGILLAAIVPTVRNLLLMKDLMQRHRISAGYSSALSSALGRLPAHEASHLPRKKDGTLNIYPLSLAASHASNFTLAELTQGFRECAAAAHHFFSSQLENDVILARLLLGLLARGSSRG